MRADIVFFHMLLIRIQRFFAPNAALLARTTVAVNTAMTLQNVSLKIQSLQENIPRKILHYKKLCWFVNVVLQN